MGLAKFTKHVLTGKDNETYDVSRVLFVVGVFVFLGLSILAVIKGQEWRSMDFGTGFAGILAGGGIGISVKSNTEPDKKDDN